MDACERARGAVDHRVGGMLASRAAGGECGSLSGFAVRVRTERVRLKPTSSRTLRPGEAVFGERQGANALSGDGEDGVAHSGNNRWQGGFAEAGGRIVGLQKMHFDFRGHLIHSNGRVFVKVALDGAAVVDGDLIV